MTRPIIVPRPDPLTVCIPAWGVLFGVGGALVYDRAPQASTEGIPAFGVYAFFAGFTLSCSVLLLGMWMRSVQGMKLKLGANVALGSLCLTYSGWSIQALGLVRAFLVWSLLLSICVASFWQARRLNAALNPKE